MTQHTIAWFELPTADIDRAIKFYSTILDKPMQRNDMNMPYSFFPAETGSVSGALIQHEEYTPNATGSVIYLDGGEDLQAIQARVESAGGKVIMPKSSIGEHGFVAMFIDTEGNRVGLHSLK